jgi:aminopeptidase Y
VDYIYSTVTGLGDYYNITNQSFPAVSGNIFESRLVLGHEVPASARPMGLTPPTKDKQPVYGQLTLVANQGCDEADYPSGLAGAIALIERGTCPFGTKSELAGKAGALAAVVYNNEQGEVSGTLGTPSPNHVATFGISDADAAPFVKQLKEGKKVDSIAYIDATVDTIHTTNIIAQTKGGDPQNCVMLGGHSDSVAEGPGINDDGSGSLTLLEIATQLSKYRVNNCVRFAWWAAEEEGLLGSDYYVSVLSEEENLKIRLFMDYDMLASPNFAYQVYNATNAVNPVGSEELRDLYTEWYTAHGLNFTYIPFDGRSDYDAFIRNGIPGGGIATGAEGVKTEEEQAMFGGRKGDWYDPCYHQLCDDLGNVNATAWEINSKVFGQNPLNFTAKLTMCTSSWLLTQLQHMLLRLMDFQRGRVSAATQWSSRNASTTDLSLSCNLDHVYCGVVVFSILILNLIHSDISHSIFTH